MHLVSVCGGADTPLMVRWSSASCVWLYLLLSLAPSLSLGADRLRDAVTVLLRVPSGRELVKQAQELWGVSEPMGILSHLKASDVSRTDAVLTRFFAPGTGKERRERKVTVYIKTDQRLEDVVMDLAHELVHATARPAWDPYDPSLTAAGYIEASIEGAGGEVAAMVVECRTGLELQDLIRDGSSLDRCKDYLQAREIAPERVKRDFYRVGRWGSELVRKLGPELRRLPLLSSDPPRLYSSTGGAPYPMALLQEFEAITQVACENTRRRVSASSDRKPASSGRSKSLAAADARRFLLHRCR